MSGILRKRDFAVLAIVAIATYLSLDSSSLTFVFEPAWYIDQRSTSFASSWVPIPPIITDLYGTGKNELVVITKESDDILLKIVDADDRREDRSRVYIPTTISSIPLTPMKLQKGRTPVALKAGYVDAYNATTGRKQVIVVVREDWSVSCYDHTLKLLWEKAVAHKTHDIEHLVDKFRIEEVAIYLTPLAISDEASNGLVIVGASMALRDPDDYFLVQQGLKMNENGEKEHPEMNQRAALEHFSIYALDAKSGQVVWRHDGLDVMPEQYIKSLPQFAYNLDIHDLATKIHKAPAIHDWTVFRQSLIAELPHTWSFPEDTNMRLAHFIRRHVGSTGDHHTDRHAARKSASINTNTAPAAPVKPTTTKKTTTTNAAKSGKGSKTLTGEGRFTGVETPPLEKGANLPHDASEHTDHPNVIVTHTSKGVEVIAVKTGTPVTSLALSPGKSYADIDGDGVVDTITILENERDLSALKGEVNSLLNSADTLRHCMITVTSGLPQKSELFSGTVCGGSHYLQDPISTSGRDAAAERGIPPPNRGGRGQGQGSRSYRYSSGAAVPASIAAAPPLFMRTIHQKTLRESKSRDVVVAINTGVVTSYGADGEFKWQIRGAPKWQVEDKSQVYTLQFDSDADRVSDVGSHDTVNADIVVIGTSSFALISKDGYLQTEVELPSKPTSRPILGDFDGDGVTDLIILTNDAILGYRLVVKQSMRGMLIAVIVMSVIAAIVFFANIRALTPEEIDRANAAAAAAAGGSGGSTTARAIRPIRAPRKRGGGVLSIIRSTDEHHID